MQQLNENDVVLQEKTGFGEQLYYKLPGFLRRAIWHFLLKRPVFAFKRMGNVAVTSLGMIGQLNGWFIHRTVHPISFGVGSVLKKPVIKNDKVEVGEVLNMTVLIDHDVIDGAPMVRFIDNLVRKIESGIMH